MKFPTHGHLTVDAWRVLSSPKSPFAQEEVVDMSRHMGSKLASSLGAAADNQFGFAEVGQMTGFWIGMVWGLATLPVVVLDGPLPVADAAWLIGWSAFTLRAMAVGEYIGSEIDERL